MTIINAQNFTTVSIGPFGAVARISRVAKMGALYGMSRSYLSKR